MGGTLGVVIGTRTRRVREADALRHVGSYVVVNDVSIPHQSYFRPAIRQRCRDTFCVIGSAVARDSAPSVECLEIRIKVNDELRCVSNTADLVRGVARLVSDISDFITLSPGDTVLVGEPEDAPLAGVGDQVRVEIDGIGAIENSILSEGGSRL
jgi:5-oxopent-3-ene-1,2,5-tricarboxylate decarboxylase/2-hydroxyhepta-2,4-diene-1,7-dioate isomerase